jgi:hypothetical protein
VKNGEVEGRRRNKAKRAEGIRRNKVRRMERER